MCGINGIIGKINTEKGSVLVGKMNVAMQHRGPDDDGVFASDGAALGHRRLSIIDLSAAGHQPMVSKDGRYQMVFNGEIYNYLEVKETLAKQGHQIQYTTKTDSEVLLNAYILLGADCLQLLNGMFAFAIYDTIKKELFIARDRLGIKPIYYAFADDCFLFASEIRSLLATNIIQRKLDTQSLSDYIRYQTVHAPNTLVANVKMIMPAHYALVNLDNAATKTITEIIYWSATKNHKVKNSTKSYNEICEDVKHFLQQSVKRRLVADVPFGAFLSGGIDSSAVVGLMSEVSNTNIKTFSVTFDEEEFSEAKYARLIANKFNTEHTEIKLRPDDFMQELPHALNAMDHPSGDGPNTYIVSKVTKQAGITMALSGLGGDEMFCGYDVFRRMKKLQQYNFLSSIPSPIKYGAAAVYKKINDGIAAEKIAELLHQKSFKFPFLYPLTRQLVTETWLQNILKPELIQANMVTEIAMQQRKFFDVNHIFSQTSLAEINTYMQNVLLRDTDQMSMAVALEVRVPFLDYTLVEYVMDLEDSVKYPSTPKKLLVDSLGDLLPDEIVNRKKMGFTLPWKHWMKNELKQMSASHIHSLANRSYFNKQSIELVWQRFLNDDNKTTWSRVWYLIVLENWLQKNNIE